MARIVHASWSLRAVFYLRVMDAVGTIIRIIKEDPWFRVWKGMRVVDELSALVFVATVCLSPFHK
jgi:hypothetical protein